MGQKINPNIFRLGINKKWKTEFFEKKRHELPLYTFKDLEIKTYIERFLNKNGIILHDYKQHYSNSTLNLYISYLILPEFIVDQKNKINAVYLINKSGDVKSVEKTNSTKNSALTFSSQKDLFKTNASTSYYKIREYLSLHSNFFKLPIKVSTSILNPSHNLSLKTEGVLNNLFKVLSLFTKNKFNIIINFSCLNKDLNFVKGIQTKNLVLLQKFKGTPFLKEGFELLFYTAYVSNSASLLAKFVAIQIKKVKRHKFFLSFLKQAFAILLNFSSSRIKGIKIMITGRLNGVPRAKHKIITIGDVPIQSINETVDYCQTTTHNSNGSYGIKIWIVEKQKIN